MADKGPFALIVGFIAGLVILFFGLILFRKKQAFDNTPTSKVRSIAMGLAEVYGEALPAQGKTLKSPFSGADCLYFYYKVEELRRSKNGTYWATVKDGKESVPFYVQDETGKVLVDPNGAEVDIPQDYQTQSVDKVKKFLDANNIGSTSLFIFNKMMRFTEYYIAPKDKLYVFGTAGDNPFVEDASAASGVEDVMISKGSRSELFYIADKPEKEITKELAWKVPLCIFGGALLSVACLIMLLLYFRVAL